MEQLQNQLDAIGDGDWVPTFGSENKQKSPNQIRSAIRKYLADKQINQTEFLRRIGINGNSYNKFMTQRYKNEWSATENGTYWAAARLFAREALEEKMRVLAEKEDKKKNKGSTKRKAADISEEGGESKQDSEVGVAVVATVASTIPAAAAPKKPKKAEVEKFLESILAVDVPENCPVYANCDEVRAMIAKFQREHAITDAAFLRSIGSQSNSLKSFRTFKGKGAGASNQVYHRAWRLLEQYRIFQNKPKSAKHLEQEKRWGPSGFPLHHDDGKRWTFAGDSPDPKMFDIEYCRDMRNSGGTF